MASLVRTRKLGCFALLALLATTACSGDDGVAGSGGDAGSGGSSAAAGSGADAGSGGVSGSGASAGSSGSSGDSGAGGSAGDTQYPPYSKGKFIPTFAIKYGNAGQGLRSPEETAKFDLLITSIGHHAAWKGSSSTSWQELKKLNPDLLIFVYTLGPAEYNTSSWGALGYESGELVHGWDWMKQNHGIGQPDQWIEAGASTDLPLYNTNYPNERMMQLGNPNWLAYYREKNYTDVFGGGRGIDVQGVDGLFLDNMSLGRSIMENSLKSEGTHVSDEAESYVSSNGGFDRDKWKEDYRAAFEQIIPKWREQGVLAMPNFSPGPDAQLSAWQELETFETASGESAAPFAAMEEAAFISPYGSQPAYYAWNWKDKLAGLIASKKSRNVQLCHGPARDDTSLAAMDEEDFRGTSGWDALWFCIGSFMLGFDDVAGNGYVAFTAWGYLNYRFFDEFDPTHLHLGKALGAHTTDGNVKLREFEDGWFVVNGGEASASVQVPGGAAARVLDHASYKQPDTVTAVTSFTLPGYRAVVLLKPGKQIGNADND